MLLYMVYFYFIFIYSLVLCKMCSVILHMDFVYCDIAKFTYFSLFFPVYLLGIFSRFPCYLLINNYYLFPILMVLFFLYCPDDNLHYNFLYI